LSNSGFLLFNTLYKAITYAEDVSLVGSSPRKIQPTLDALLIVASKLGIRFIGTKYSFLSLISAEHLFTQWRYPTFV
jgi:hypothetical protein